MRVLNVNHTLDPVSGGTESLREVAQVPAKTSGVLHAIEWCDKDAGSLTAHRSTGRA